ncbi:MAG: hypothetical protein ACLTE2_06170 [Eubacteriales bacterium]
MPVFDHYYLCRHANLYYYKAGITDHACLHKQRSVDHGFSLLNENARLTNAQLAVMLGKTAEEVEKEIADYNKRYSSKDIKR